MVTAGSGAGCGSTQQWTIRYRSGGGQQRGGAEAFAEVTEQVPDSKAEDRVASLKVAKAGRTKAPRELQRVAQRLSTAMSESQRRPILSPDTLAHRMRRFRTCHAADYAHAGWV